MSSSYCTWCKCNVSTSRAPMRLRWSLPDGEKLNMEIWGVKIYISSVSFPPSFCHISVIRLVRDLPALFRYNQGQTMFNIRLRGCAEISRKIMQLIGRQKIISHMRVCVREREWWKIAGTVIRSRRRRHWPSSPSLKFRERRWERALSNCFCRSTTSSSHHINRFNYRPATINWTIGELWSSSWY